MKVVVTGSVREEGLSIVREFADLVILPEPINEKDVARELRDADGMLHKMGHLGKPELEGATRLKMIARHGVGLDYLDLPYIKTTGIPVSITNTANSNAVAEACIGLMLTALRNFRQGEAMLKVEKRWARETLMGGEIRGRTIGLIGYGRVGSLVGNLLDAFGANVLVYDINPALAKAAGRTLVSLDELLAKADIISLHLPLTAETKHLFNAQRIAQCKKGVIFVNTARGAIFDTHALVEAVKSGQVRAVATDTFDTEPPAFDSEIFSDPRIMTTPHMSAMTSEAQVAVAVSSANELKRVLVEGLPPTNNVLA